MAKVAAAKHPIDALKGWVGAQEAGGRNVCVLRQVAGVVSVPSGEGPNLCQVQRRLLRASDGVPPGPPGCGLGQVDGGARCGRGRSQGDGGGLRRGHCQHASVRAPHCATRLSTQHLHQQPPRQGGRGSSGRERHPCRARRARHCEEQVGVGVSGAAHAHCARAAVRAPLTNVDKGVGQKRPVLQARIAQGVHGRIEQQLRAAGVKGGHLCQGNDQGEGRGGRVPASGLPKGIQRPRNAHCKEGQLKRVHARLRRRVDQLGAPKGQRAPPVQVGLCRDQRAPHAPRAAGCARVARPHFCSGDWIGYAIGEPPRLRVRTPCGAKVGRYAVCAQRDWVGGMGAAHCARGGDKVGGRAVGGARVHLHLCQVYIEGCGVWLQHVRVASGDKGRCLRLPPD